MYSLTTKYDVVVVGGGHAGIEGALAAARLGSKTLLLTQNLDTIGQMSCNPAIGGIGKGHIVREIDALGGIMGKNADATSIQARMLNRSKGPSVQAPRVQCDKKAYQLRLKMIVEQTDNLDVKQAGVSSLLTRCNKILGVETDVGFRVGASTVVITSGTFLGGLLHVGDTKHDGGRMADKSSSLSESIRTLGIASRRFKTGTPPRISRRSIDFSKCEVQWGDDPKPRFCFDKDENSELFHVEQMPCWITHTINLTHEIILKNLDRSPLYSGRILGIGPRYCPSIEDKVVKFPGKATHQIFLEPEGNGTSEIYVNGISTSLPFEVQVEFIRTIPGLERAEIMRPGYAVEYDYFPPTQLSETLESTKVDGLFFAGQVNGTSGYEEAAAQGLIAGTNASLKSKGAPAFTLAAREAYIGVMLQDLVAKGTEEPYRMFTSRASDRLSLRHDTADQRLIEKAYRYGLVSTARFAEFTIKRDALSTLREFVASNSFNGTFIAQLLKQPKFQLESLPVPIRQRAPDQLWHLVETECKYAGYIDRQAKAIKALRSRGSRPLPVGFDYNSVPGLKAEARDRFRQARPTSLWQAEQISGITPADIDIIHIWLDGNDIF